MNPFSQHPNFFAGCPILKKNTLPKVIASKSNSGHVEGSFDNPVNFLLPNVKQTSTENPKLTEKVFFQKKNFVQNTALATNYEVLTVPLNPLSQNPKVFC